MPIEKSFDVLGGRIDVLVSSRATGGAFMAATQTFTPGGGPPPHIHTREDEYFLPCEGEFEVFLEETGEWVPVTQAGVWAPRGRMHTFRNCGSTEGKLIVIATPGGLDEFLEEISVVEMPRDFDLLISLSAAHGITYPAQAGDSQKQQEKPAGSLAAI